MGKTRFEIAQPVIEREMAKPYAYGVADCFVIAARVADALDPEAGLMATYGGRYKTLLGSRRVMMRLGFVSLTDLLDKHVQRVGPAMCRFGDLAVVELSDGEHFAICVGQRFLVKLPSGPRLCGMDEVKAAFRVG